MKRFLFNLVWGLSALLCCLSGFLWATSHEICPSVWWTPQTTRYDLWSMRGRLFVFRFYNWYPKKAVTWELMSLRGYHPEAIWCQNYHKNTWEVTSRRGSGGFETARGTYQPRFSLEYWHRARVAFHVVIIPYWFIILLTAAMPVGAVWRSIRRARDSSEAHKVEAARAGRRVKLVLGLLCAAVVLIVAVRILSFVHGQPRYPLHFAVREGDRPVFERLVAEGADVNAVDDSGRTPLHWAALEGPKYVRLLVDNGADVNVADSSGITPLYFATGGIDGADPRSVEILLAKGAEVNVKTEDGQTPLHQAAGFGNAEIVTLLLEKGARVNVRGSYGDTPLHLAARRDKRRVELLLAGGADPKARNEKGRTPLHNAASADDEGIALLLLEKGADASAADAEDRTPLFYAAAANNQRIVKRLLAKGADVKLKRKDGQTPLHWAGGADMAEMLLRSGAEVNAKDRDGRTPLHGEARHGDEGTIRVLLKNGADVNVADDNGLTPLHAAAGWGHWIEKSRKNVIELLLTAGAKVNAQSKEGWAPLHKAANAEDWEMAELLLKNGAEANARDREGRTPLDFARNPPDPRRPWSPETPKRRRKMVEVLVRHGGKEGKDLPKQRQATTLEGR